MRKTATVLAAALLLTAPQALRAQTSANANASVSVQVLAGLSLTKNTDLSFGTIVATNGVQNVTVNATGANGAGQSAAKFTAAGEPSTAVTVTWTAPATLSDGGDNTMAVSASQVWSHTADTQGSATQIASSGDAVTLSGTGARFFWVGATLTVGANQVSGTYTGSFNLAVAY